MSAAQHWNVSNTRCDMQIEVDAGWVHIDVDAGRPERYRVRLHEYLSELAAPPQRTHREMVWELAGGEVARAVEAAVKARLAPT